VMFERFTPEARSIVVEAQVHARRLDHRIVGTEHLLLALVANHGPPGQLLRVTGMTVEGITADIARWTTDRKSEDRQALASLGIDLDRVREATELAFGVGALDREPMENHRRLLRRLRRRARLQGEHNMCSGHLRFSARAKKVLELSLREALRLKHNYIGPEHILLGLLREGQGLACALLVQRVPLEQLRSAIERTIRRSA